MNLDGGTPVMSGPDDGGLLDALARFWESVDPVPADLAERVCFALGLDDLEAELLALRDDVGLLAGARADDQVRTVTFSSDTLSVMVMINDGQGTHVRLDGWIDDGGGLDITLRAQGQERSTAADQDGRFSFDAVPRGLTQLVFRPTEGAGLRLPRNVVTPVIQI